MSNQGAFHQRPARLGVVAGRPATDGVSFRAISEAWEAVAPDPPRRTFSSSSSSSSSDGGQRYRNFTAVAANYAFAGTAWAIPDLTLAGACLPDCPYYEAFATDWRSVATADDIDLVHICTPNHLPLDMALAVADTGGGSVVGALQEGRLGFSPGRSRWPSPPGLPPLPASIRIR